MHEHHSHGPDRYNRAFAFGVLLNVLFVLTEAGFGFWVNSLALLADAGHNLSDIIGLLLAWGANRLVKIRSSEGRTYGWRSSTIMAAMINALLLLVAVGMIVMEAVQRLASPQPAEGGPIMAVAGVGVVINALTALLFVSGRKEDLNIRGAFMHMAADAGVSLGVVLAGFVIWLWGVLWIDPVMSLVVAAVIFFGTWGLLRESVNMALQAVPKNVDLAEVRAYLSSLPGVVSIHDLHVWALSTTEIALTVHLIKPDPADDDDIIRQAEIGLKERFKIDHTTIQWEREMCQSDVCSLD